MKTAKVVFILGAIACVIGIVCMCLGHFTVATAGIMGGASCVMFGEPA